MKLCLGFILLFCSLAFADVRINNGKLTVNVANQPLDKIVDTLRQQTDIRFYIDEDVIDQSIYADFQNLPIGRGIKKMLEGTEINFAVIANDGQTKAIFIGSSQELDASYKKLQARSPIAWSNQSTHQRQAIRQPTRPAKVTVPASKKKEAVDKPKPVVNIPTAGALNTSPIPQNEKQSN